MITNYWGTSCRGLGIDRDNNLWVGTGRPLYFHINGETGAILRTVSTAGINHSSYGLVIDANGIIWASGFGYTYVNARIDPSTNPAGITTWAAGASNYGVGLDHLGNLLSSDYNGSTISKIDTNTGTTTWFGKPVGQQPRGICATADNDIWVACTGSNDVYRLDNLTGAVKAIIGGMSGPTGVAVDAAGKVWACDVSGNFIHRIDPATDTVDMSVDIPRSGGHYSYSDMTGIVARTITTRLGTWTIDVDGGRVDAPWDTVSWNAGVPDVPEGTSISVRVRSSNDKATWSVWETATNGVPLSTTPRGQFLQVETTLQITSGDVSPVLYDLSVAGNQPPVAEAGGPYVV